MLKLPQLSHLAGKPWALAGQASNSRGGGALEPLAEELCKLGLAAPVGCLVTSCMLHALSLTFRKPVEAAFGASKAGGESNAAQLALSCWSVIQGCLSQPAHRGLFDLIIKEEKLNSSTNKWEKIEKPAFVAGGTSARQLRSRFSSGQRASSHQALDQAAPQGRPQG